MQVHNNNIPIVSYTYITLKWLDFNQFMNAVSLKNETFFFAIIRFLSQIKMNFFKLQNPVSVMTGCGILPLPTFGWSFL